MSKLLTLEHDLTQPIQMNPDQCRLEPADLRDAAPLLAAGSDRSLAGEEYRTVRNRIARALDRPFRLAISSPSVGDGKTFTAVNLSVAFALAGDVRTLLIDGDLRRASIHRSLRTSPGPGLADLLASECSLQEAIIWTGMPGLYVLPGGEPRDNVSELFSTPCWETLTSSLTAHFPQIVVDCPPVDLFADFDLIVDNCDAALLVVRPDNTNRELLSAALAKLPPKLLGVLINHVDDSILNPRHKRSYYGYHGAERG